MPITVQDTPIDIRLPALDNDECSFDDEGTLIACSGFKFLFRGDSHENSTQDGIYRLGGSLILKTTTSPKIVRVTHCPHCGVTLRSSA